MAEIVAAIACGHAPGIATRPEPDPAGRKQRVYDAYKRARGLLAETRPTALIVVTDDHIQNFFFNNWPTLCIAFPEQMEGPAETWMPIPHYEVRGYPQFGRHLLTQALQSHFDPAWSQEFQPDHGIMLPLHHMRPEMDLPLTVVLQNCVEPPLAPLDRFAEFGRVLGQAIAAWPQPDRFAIIGVGGISHWIGIKRMGEINEAWDRWFLDCVCQGRLDDILRLTPEDVERDAGNGGEEIRNWITVMSAIGARPGELVGYEAVPEWVCGAGIVFWDLSRDGNGHSG
jgi:aromatic ring-opening dioxygenase catalytic subunit (LigB family)